MPEQTPPARVPGELSPKAALWTAIFMAIGLVATFAGIRAFETHLGRINHTESKIAEQPFDPPLPHLQVDSARDLAAFRAEEEQKLHTYGWVDRSNGVVRVPVERAIELTLQRGLPARAEKKGIAP